LYHVSIGETADPLAWKKLSATKKAAPSSSISVFLHCHFGSKRFISRRGSQSLSIPIGSIKRLCVVQFVSFGRDCGRRRIAS